MKLGVIIDHIDMGIFTLPQFQRGYVWNRSQVRNFMLSLYKDYPVGILLIWKTAAYQRDIKGDKTLALGIHDLLLDGQQRITTLYGITKGEAPPFFEGNATAFLNLYFNVESEEFEFYGPTKMKNNPLWISVTELMQMGAEHYFELITNYPDKVRQFLKRLSKIASIKDREFQIETLVGENISMDVVVDIFDQVNSGGTKLSKGDLALAKICADWPQAREEMQNRLNKWGSHGYWFSLDWLLRCMNALITGHGDFKELSRRGVAPEHVLDGLQRAEKHIDSTLNLMSAYLGLDDSSVLRSPNSIPAIVRLLDKSGGMPDQQGQSQLLYWYTLSALRGRYSSAVETRVRQDLVAIAEHDDPVAALIQVMQDDYGELELRAANFDASTANSRFFPTLYMLTRVYGARDFGTGILLDKTMIGKMGRLERHHLFPRAYLRKHGIFQSYETNALANFTFLTQETNQKISAMPPEDYFPQYEDKHPGVLASHWIPDDPQLWKIENYCDFLAARRELLAKAANEFLDQLLHGTMPEAEAPQSIFDQEAVSRPIHIASDKEETELIEAMDWMQQHSLPRGEFGYELLNPKNELIATLDLAWPQGVQTGRGGPVALLIDEDEATLKIASSQGFTCFTNVAQLQTYVQNDIQGE